MKESNNSLRFPFEQQRITEEEIAAILALYRRGLNISSIARLLGLSRTSVENVIRRFATSVDGWGARVAKSGAGRFASVEEALEFGEELLRRAASADHVASYVAKRVRCGRLLSTVLVNAYNYLSYRVRASAKRVFLAKLACVATLSILNPAVVSEAVAGNPELERVATTMRDLSDRFEVTDAIRTALSMDANTVLAVCRDIHRKCGDLTRALDPLATLAVHPLAHRLFFNLYTMSKHGRFVTYRVGVFADLGGGKTTFVFSALWAIAASLGLDEAEAARAARAMIRNRFEEAVELVMVSTERQVPFIVLDDAGTVFSKYSWYDPLKRKLMILFNEQVKIVRENVAGFVVMSDATKERLVKALRESIDREYVGIGELVEIGGTQFRATLWLRNPVISRRTTRFSWSRDQIVERVGADEAFATIHPPLFIPNEQYSELERIKLEMRREYAEALMRIMEEIKEKEKGEGGEGEVEVEELIPEAVEEGIEEENLD